MLQRRLVCEGRERRTGRLMAARRKFGWAQGYALPRCGKRLCRRARPELRLRRPELNVRDPVRLTPCMSDGIAIGCEFSRTFFGDLQMENDSLEKKLLGDWGFELSVEEESTVGGGYGCGPYGSCPYGGH